MIRKENDRWEQLRLEKEELKWKLERKEEDREEYRNQEGRMTKVEECKDRGID